MSLVNLSLAYERMRQERDGAEALLDETLKERAGLRDYLCAHFYEKNAGAETFLLVEAEAHLPELRARRESGVAEA